MAAAADVATWVETDSLTAINNRIDRDFSLSLEEASNQMKKLYSGLTDADIARYIDSGYIEVRKYPDGVHVYRKSPRNLPLIHPQMRAADGWKCRGALAPASRLGIADTISRLTRDGNGEPVYPHRVKIRFSVDVPYYDMFEGDTVRVWMPYPLESARQSNIAIVDASQPDYVISTPEKSAHRTIYMEQPVEKGKPAHFEYTFTYDVAGQYFSPDYILSNMKPYDREGDLYKKYTDLNSSRHIVEIPLAREIVGNETNPFRQSEMVYDYIINNYPWAGAREYSTLDCIPRYVLDHGYGDCGQVSLLYISMMRTLGVPARWESGWMLHPNESNYHDWAEVYFEGVGWVPVDTSFGRYIASDNPAVRNFHSHGQDIYRFATNQAVGDRLYPAKKYVRSETVDFQAGEVETSKGNLFYPLWNSHFELVDMTPITE